MIDDQFIRPDDVEKFLQELRSGQRRQCPDRREAIREGSIDRRAAFDRRDPDADRVFRVAKQSNHKPVINREEQLARLRKMDKVYFGVRITRARCAPAIKLLDMVYSLHDAPLLPLEACTEVCTCQYAGVRDQRMVLRRTGPPDRRQAIREGHPVRRKCHGRRKTDVWLDYGTL